MPTSRVHLTVKPPTAKVAEPQPIEQQQPTEQTQPTVQQTTPPATAQIPTQEVEEDNPEYALSRSIIKKLANEIVVAKKKIKTQK